MLETSVRWNARNYATRFNVGLGNHHYVLIVCGPEEFEGSFLRIKHKDHQFFTLGGFEREGNLVFLQNNKSDIESAREFLDGESLLDTINPFDWGTQSNRVASPNRSASSFASLICRLARNYRENTFKTPYPYTLTNSNCSAWVNTLFSVAGVPKEQRVLHGEFRGIDWGEEDYIPKELFQ